MQMNHGKNSRTVTKMTLAILGVWSVSIFGYGCNNQKAEAPKKAATQTASATEDNRRKEVPAPKSEETKDADAEEKTETKNTKRKNDDSGSSKNSSSRINNLSGDFDAVISRLGLTRGEGEALQRFACSRDPEELARLASRFGGGGSSGRNGFNLDRSGSSGFSRDDLDALRAFAGSGREVSPDTIKRAQDALCNASSGSGSGNAKNSSSRRSSRDDDDDDDDDN